MKKHMWVTCVIIFIVLYSIIMSFHFTNMKKSMNNEFTSTIYRKFVHDYSEFKTAILTKTSYVHDNYNIEYPDAYYTAVTDNDSLNNDGLKNFDIENIRTADDFESFDFGGTTYKFPGDGMLCPQDINGDGERQYYKINLNNIDEYENIAQIGFATYKGGNIPEETYWISECGIVFTYPGCMISMNNGDVYITDTVSLIKEK